MPRYFPAALLAFAALILSCGGGSDGGAPLSATGAGTLATATATLESSGDKPTPAPTPEPGEIWVANEPFSVETSDGVVLKGHAYTPDGPKRHALIIVAPVEQSIWAESTQAFTSEGIAVFTFDPRGFGETGGEEDADALADDVRLITRFVMSREYPLVYLFGVGQEGAQASIAVAGVLDELTGLVTYGFGGEIAAPNYASVAPDVSWDGEDALAGASVQDAVLQFVLGRD